MLIIYLLLVVNYCCSRDGVMSDLAIARLFIVGNPGVDGRLGSRRREQEFPVLFMAILQDTWWHKHFSPLGPLMMCSWSTRFFRPGNGLLLTIEVNKSIKMCCPQLHLLHIPVFEIMRIYYGTPTGLKILIILLCNRDVYRLLGGGLLVFYCFWVP